MTKLERWKLEYGCMYPHELGEVCLSEDVARLEASHTELLEALQMLVRDFADYPAYDRPCLAFDKARAAVAKAEETKGEPT